MSEPARTALVVDDNLALLSVIEYHLQKSTFDVTVAANGQEGPAPSVARAPAGGARRPAEAPQRTDNLGHWAVLPPKKEASLQSEK